MTTKLHTKVPPLSALQTAILRRTPPAGGPGIELSECIADDGYRCFQSWDAMARRGLVETFDDVHGQTVRRRTPLGDAAVNNAHDVTEAFQSVCAEDDGSGYPEEEFRSHVQRPYVSRCPETGRLFLCEPDIDNNVCELTPQLLHALRAWTESGAASKFMFDPKA